MSALMTAYRLRWRRRRLLWQAFRSRHDLKVQTDRTGAITGDAILAVMCVRNESARLPWFLNHHRRLGVKAFLVIDNASTDGTAEYLADQPDVSLWSTSASYRGARFGLAWMTWLQMRYAHGHWCLMLDADELLTYDGVDRHDLHALTGLLDRTGQAAFGTLMLDLFPRTPLGAETYLPGTDPVAATGWFDAGPYRAVRQQPIGNLWVQGGARERVFFPDRPERSPTLNKLPLVRWNRRFAYTNACHAILPRGLNRAYDGPGDPRPSGVLLHTKFLPGIVERSVEEKARQQHFARPRDYDRYYDQIAERPVLWHPEARQYTGPSSLIDAGLMPEIDWSA